MPQPVPHPLPWAHTRQGLAAQLATIDGLLPGSVITRMTRCGKPNCACNADPPVLHGPYIQWTRTTHGKTVTRILSPTELERYQPWFDNARRLKNLIANLQTASIHAIETEHTHTRPNNPQPSTQSPT